MSGKAYRKIHWLSTTVTDLRHLLLCVISLLTPGDNLLCILNNTILKVFNKLPRFLILKSGLFGASHGIPDFKLRHLEGLLRTISISSQAVAKAMDRSPHTALTNSQNQKKS